VAPPRKLDFPAGFLWGTASAAHQVEGQNYNCDWWEFEKQGGIKTGDSADPACDHYNRFREDFQLLRKLNNNAHRLSVEWSRIQPSPGEFSGEAMSHYRDVLQELRNQGIAATVTLHHFTSPIWFTERGGWEATGSPEAWMPFVGRVAEELGDLVDYWCTINEPNIYAYNGWMAGEFPPARRGDLAGMYRVLANLRKAHELAYRELKRATPDVPVGLAQNKWLTLPADPDRRRDVWAAQAAQTAMDRWPIAPGRLQRVVQASGDYVGLNHYSGSLVAFDPRRRTEQFMRLFNPPGAPESDFGWAIRPEWMQSVLEDLAPLGKPIYITENGIATQDDSRRERFLCDVLVAVHAAIKKGVDVRGYFHWTAMDNFEWARGYSMHFGLVEVDRESQARRIRPSGELYARIAAANALASPPSGREGAAAR
jgi:beta-glucosidase